MRHFIIICLASCIILCLCVGCTKVTKNEVIDSSAIPGIDTDLSADNYIEDGETDSLSVEYISTKTDEGGIPGTDDDDNALEGDIASGDDIASASDFEVINELINTKVTTISDEEKAQLNTLPEIEYVEPDSVEMIPYEAESMGYFGGYLLIPLDGELYRFEPADTSEDYYTAGDVICEFDSRDEIGNSHHYTVYELDEYPSHEKVRMVEDDFSTVFVYAPLIRTASEVYEKAEALGFVILKNGSLDSNKDKWLDFIDQVEQGIPAVVCIGHLYTLDGRNMSLDLYEAEKDDYPKFFMEELIYDGEGFTLAPVNFIDGEFVQCLIPGYNSPTVTYPYLMHYKNKARTGYEGFDYYDKYVLTDRTDVTWEDMEMDSILCYFTMHYEEVCGEYK